ncbi:hypothetical protein B0J17DRAFT_747240 [Rhizoctonia solani]|nr:hypothetical protein B0J17DRAFT_747240 [Rhizoctonia solani]
MSTLCSNSINYSFRYSSRRDSTHKCLLRFSEEFLQPSDEITDWYNVQPYKRFHALQYRKEMTAIGHEFILVPLQGEEGGNVTSYCRVERVGDPEHRLQSICIDGTIAEDYIQATPDLIELTHNSYVVLEVIFPTTFDLRDILAICYGISKHLKAQRYTLQQYNCYFFSWMITVGLARMCVDWDVSSSIPEHVKNIGDDIRNSIEEQGLMRYHSVAYILSNSAYPSPASEGHPLDKHLISWLHSSAFACCIDDVLHGILWPARSEPKIIAGMRSELCIIARESWELFACEQSGPVTPSEHNSNFENAVRKLTWEAIETGFNSSKQNFIKAIACAAPEIDILKRRMGHKWWCKSLASAIWHPTRAYSSTSREPTNFHLYHLPESLIPDYLFIPPAFLLGLCARLIFSCAVIGVSFATHIVMEYRLGGCRNEKTFQRKVQCIRNAFRSSALRSVGVSIASRRLLDILVLSCSEKEYELFRPWLTEGGELAFELEFEQMVLAGYNQSLEMLNNGLLELIKSAEEPQLSTLRPYFSTALKNISNLSRRMPSELWEGVFLQHFLNKTVGVASRDVEALIQQANTEKLFRVRAATRTSDGSPSQEGGCGTSGATKRSLFRLEIEKKARHEPWSYKELVQFIEERILRLSKRENEFAPVLKHVPLTTSPEKCRTQIEVSMEQIRCACRPLMVTRPQE